MPPPRGGGIIIDWGGKSSLWSQKEKVSHSVSWIAKETAGLKSRKWLKVAVLHSRLSVAYDCDSRQTETEQWQCILICKQRWQSLLCDLISLFNVCAYAKYVELIEFCVSICIDNVMGSLYSYVDVTWNIRISQGIWCGVESSHPVMTLS